MQREPPIDLHLAGKALTLEEAKAYLARTNWNADAARALVKAEGRTFFESHGTSRLLRRLLTHQRLSVGLSLRRRINHRHVVPVVSDLFPAIEALLLLEAGREAPTEASFGAKACPKKESQRAGLSCKLEAAAANQRPSVSLGRVSLLDNRSTSWGAWALRLYRVQSKVDSPSCDCQDHQA